jgi:L-2-hydroxyglutarate oxidase LhgO
MAEELDTVVVGAGVVGLAVARSLAHSGHEVVVLEAEANIGMHTSSRNSEVIHAGIYYPQGSLKAELCVKGREMLYDYCERQHIPFQRIGKIIVAADDNELEKLLAIQAQAEKNGVPDLRIIDNAEMRELEPEVAGRLALLSPSTGIVDSHSLMMALRADIESHNGIVLPHSRLMTAKVTRDGFRLKVKGSDDEFGCKTLINAGGLFAEWRGQSMDSAHAMSAEFDMPRVITFLTQANHRSSTWFIHCRRMAGLEFMLRMICRVRCDLGRTLTGLIRLIMTLMRADRSDLQSLFASTFPVWMQAN